MTNPLCVVKCSGIGRRMQLFPRRLYAEDNSYIHNLDCMLGTVEGLMVGDLYKVCYLGWNIISHNLPTRQVDRSNLHLDFLKYINISSSSFLFYINLKGKCMLLLFKVTTGKSLTYYRICYCIIPI